MLHLLERKLSSLPWSPESPLLWTSGLSGSLLIGENEGKEVLSRWGPHLASHGPPDPCPGYPHYPLPICLQPVGGRPSRSPQPGEGWGPLGGEGLVMAEGKCLWDLCPHPGQLVQHAALPLLCLGSCLLQGVPRLISAGQLLPPIRGPALV